MGKHSKVYLRSTPHPVTVTNEGLLWGFLTKNGKIPGGDWNPGWGEGIPKVDSNPKPPNQCCTTGNTQTGELAPPNLDIKGRSGGLLISNSKNVQ